MGTNERQALQNLERTIKLKEGQFETDAAAVAERMLELENVLVEQTEIAKRSFGALQAAKEERENVIQRLTRLDELMEAEETKFDRELLVQKRIQEDTTKTLSSLRMHETTLKAETARTAENIADMKLEVETEQNAEAVLVDDARSAKKEIHTLEMALEKRIAYEHELMDTMKARDETIALLRTQVQAKNEVEASLQKQVRAAEYELQNMKDKLSEKQRIEDLLVTQLETTKMQFTKVAPADPDVALQTGMHRADAHRAEYAHALLKILKN